MSKKAFRPPRIAPLQRVVAEPVTDPEEIAAMEEVYKRLKRMQRRQKPLIVYRRVKKTPPRKN
jgi:3-hydroxyacyl-CoA dehydrogenase